MFSSFALESYQNITCIDLAILCASYDSCMIRLLFIFACQSKYVSLIKFCAYNLILNVLPFILTTGSHDNLLQNIILCFNSCWILKDWSVQEP